MKTFLALGDSYTIGELVAETDRWTYQLVDLINENQPLLEKPITIAKTGWTTDELLLAIKEASITETFDLVTLLIGVNNQYRGRSIENYETEFLQLVQQAIGFANNDKARIIVVSIPDWGVTPFALKENRDTAIIASEINAFNAAQQKICENQNIVFVSITELSRLDLPNLLTNDELHPSKEQYALWADAVLPAALQLFSK
jgi:lysophospholipase L1-like esterase